jgi:hypothetical protein
VPVLRELNAVLTPAHALAPEIPLVLHARYLGVELSAAFDHRTKEGSFRDYYTGVEPTDGGKVDLLLVTLDKAAATKEHLRYRDFPLNERRFHWQSDDRPGVTMGFRYLGPVEPDGDREERPITIEWRLRYAMPHEVLAAGRVAV